MDMGLYDSDTGQSLEPIRLIDVTAHQKGADEALLAFTNAKRGLIVQLHSDGTRIHYFLNEDGGRRMMAEDSERFGFAPGKLLELAIEHMPPANAEPA